VRLDLPKKELDDVIGDVLDLYDPAHRRGITLSAYSERQWISGQGDDSSHLLWNR